MNVVIHAFSFLKQKKKLLLSARENIYEKIKFFNQPVIALCKENEKKVHSLAYFMV